MVLQLVDSLILVFQQRQKFGNHLLQKGNVVAAQRGDDSKLVDIYYDLTNTDGQLLLMLVSRA